jgi:hypothetical protein
MLYEADATPLRLSVIVALRVEAMLICTGFGVTLVLVTGGVLSILIPLTDAGTLTFPATSVQVPLAEKPVPSVLRITGAVQPAMPDSASVPANVTVTLVLFQPAALGAGIADATAVGGVMSSLSVADTDAASPAPSTAMQVNVMPAVSVARATGSQPVVRSGLIPEIESVAVQFKVTAVLFQPAAFGVGLITGRIAGGLVSIITLTDAEAVAPLLSVAVHVNVVPLVSADNVELPQPVLEAIPVGYVTLQLTVTGSELIQPDGPGAGVTVGVITGGFGLGLLLVTVSCVANPLPAKSAVASVWVFPAASVEITLLTVHVPFSLVLGNIAVADPVTATFAVKVAVAVCVVPPDGLRKFAWMFATPERSSVA